MYFNYCHPPLITSRITTVHIVESIAHICLINSRMRIVRLHSIGIIRTDAITHRMHSTTFQCRGDFFIPTFSLRRTIPPLSPHDQLRSTRNVLSHHSCLNITFCHRRNNVCVWCVPNVADLFHCTRGPFSPPSHPPLI